MSNEPFWEVFRQTTTPMLIVGDDGVYRDGNDAVCHELGCERDGIVGQRAGVFTPALRRRDIPGLWTTLLTKPTTALMWPLQLKGGDVHDVPILFAANLAGPRLHVIAHLARRPRGHRLTPREQEITGLLADGLSGKEIARELWLSPETVRTHIRNAMVHAGARTRAQLIAVAMRAHLFML